MLKCTTIYNFKLTSVMGFYSSFLKHISTEHQVTLKKGRIKLNTNYKTENKNYATGNKILHYNTCNI